MALESIEQLRNLLTERHGLQIDEVFDTFLKTDGKKDVLLCRRDAGERVILRIGELRSPALPIEGYEGKYIRIPKLIGMGKDPVPYEIEEYIHGSMAFQANLDEGPEGRIHTELLEKLIAAYWEFYAFAESLPLEAKDVSEKIHTHFEGASHLFQYADDVQNVMVRYESFWHGQYPSKWKFSLDNLVILPDGKIGFIDNGNIGLRYFGYDIGWLIWPRWIEMKTEQYDDPLGHIEWLEEVLDQWARTMPEDIHPPLLDERCFWLIVFERLVGAVYDIANNTRHLYEWRLAAGGDEERRRKHLMFLQVLLIEAMKRIG